MREYGQIQSSYWTHPDIRSLSNEAKLIGAYLLTSQHTTAVGCFRMPKGYISIDLSMGIETVSEGFRNLSDTVFLEWCDKTEYVLIPDFLRWNPVSNPNAAKARAKEFKAIPTNSGVYPRLINAILTYPKYFDEDFIDHLETLSERFLKGSERVPERLPDNKSRPEQEQKQKQEQNKTYKRPFSADASSDPDKPEKKKKPVDNTTTRDLIQYFNGITGKNFKQVETHHALIRARLNEGHTVDEIKSVIRMKHEEWKDTRFEKFIDPQTIFKASKFNKYVGNIAQFEAEENDDLSWMTGAKNDYIEGEVVNDE